MTEILHLVEFQMSFLLFISLAGYLIASRINQSAVIGEILVGLLVGPSILGLITYTDFVSSIAHLGAVFLLFVVGMEFRFEDIAKPRYFLIAAGGVIVPWAMGYGISTLFGFPFAGSMFIATALTATSIAITANILKEMGKLDTEVARAIIGAAVIDDVLGLLVLGVTNGVVSQTLSFLSIGMIAGKAVLFLGIGSAAGVYGFRRLLAIIDGTRFTQRFPEITFIFATMVAFLYGMAAELLGLSAIVCAFIAGASLGGMRFRHGKDLQTGSEYLQIIFSSIFFVSLGILADVSAFRAHVLLFLAVLTLTAFASKLMGCGGESPARWNGSVPQAQACSLA
jgi:Kef-type K+ transport system membrane component KefB